MNHELKTWPEFFQAVIDGKKTFEVRKNDRDFKAGDVLRLREWNPRWECDPVTDRYTGRYCYVLVNYVLTGDQKISIPGLEPGYCVMSIIQI